MNDQQIAGATIVIGADTTQAVAEIGKVTSAASSMERATVPAAGRTAAALSGMGDGAGRSANQVEAASKRFVASVEKEIAALTLSRSEYRKWEAQARGISESVYAPLVSRLEAARAANEKFSASNLTAASSQERLAIASRAARVEANLQRAAFAQLPAQITDVFTSLAGGQNPLLVLIQQGGQIKDSFGGIGNTIRALAGAFTPFRIAVGAGAAVVTTLAVAFLKGQQEATNFRRALELSGNVAGATLGQLRSQAQAIASSVGTQGKAAEVLTQLAASGRIAAGALALTAEAAIRLERVGGPAAEKTAQAFADLGKTPTEAALKLNESTRFLTVSVLEQIRTLEEQGNAAEAARVAQEAYANTVIQRSKTLEQNLGTLQSAWRTIGDVARGAWDAMLNIGREDTVEQRIASLQQRLQQNVNRGFGERAIPGVGSPNDGLRTQIADLTETQRLARASADRQRSAALLVEEYEKARKGVERWADAALTATEKTNKALDEYRRNVAKVNEQRPGTFSPQDIQRQEAAIRASFAGSARAQQSDVYAKLTQRITEATAAAQQEADQTSKLTPIQRLRLDIYSKLSTEYARLTAGQRAAIARSLDEAEAIEQLAAARESEAKFIAESAAARARYLSTLDAAVASQARETEQIREQIIGLTAGKEALEAYRLTKLEDAEAELLRKEAIERGIDGDSAAADRYRQQAQGLRDLIALRRQLGGLETVKAGEEAADKAAAALTQAYQREYERITDGLTDALIKGGRSFVDYLKGLFRTLVLRPIIDPVVRSVAGSLTGTASGSAFAGTGGPDVLSLASAVNKLGSVPDALSRSISTGFQTVAQSSVGQSLGLSTLVEDAAGNVFAQATPAVSQFSQALGVAGSYLAAYTAGSAIGRAIGNGYSLNGGSGNSTINAGAAIGAVVGGPIGSAIGAAIGGVVNRLFGRKLVDSGVEGTLGAADGFTGNTFRQLDGGLFRSDKTERGAVDPQLQAVLSGSVAGIRDATVAYAEALGLPVSGIKSYTEAIKISFKDLSQEQITAAIGDALTGFGKNLVQPIAAELAPFTKQGEDAAQTLARLADAITGVNPVLRELGVSLLDISATGAGAASQLLDAFGGAGNFASLTSSYYEKFFTEQERAARGTQILTEQFAAYGQALPATREAFRALVEAQDLTTDTGREAFAALLGVAGAFDEILTVTEGAAGGLDALAQALSDFRASLDETIEATRLRTLTPAARVAELRRQQGDLFAQLATTDDPATVAERLQRVILDRIREEAAISEDLRRTQIEALTAQISALERLRDIAQEVTRTTAELSFSDLSPLNFQDQLSAARGLFEQTLSGAAGGDLNAAANVSSALQAYLEEARQFFGSDANFASIFADATGRVNALAGQGLALGTGITDAQRQLDALQQVRDTSQQELDALLALRDALRERETVAAQAATDQTAVLREQIAKQNEIIEQQKAQITQSAAIAEAQLAEARALNEAVSRLVGNSSQAINAGIEP